MVGPVNLMFVSTLSFRPMEEVAGAGVRRVLEMRRDELEGGCALPDCPSAADIPGDRVEWRTRTP